MTGAEIEERLKGTFGDDVGPLSDAKVDAFVTVKADRVVDVCRWLKDTAGVEMDHCNDITAVDQPKRGVIEVVYHLDSYARRHAIVLKAEVDRARPSIPSVQGVWKAANWLEREVYDLLGVDFRGHPDMRRILLPDDWVGHPLRKDYQEAGGYHGIGNTRTDPLVALRRLDETRRTAAAPAAASAAQAPEAPAAATAPAAASTAPAAASTAPAAAATAPAAASTAPAAAATAQPEPAAPTAANAGGEKA